MKVSRSMSGGRCFALCAALAAAPLACGSGATNVLAEAAALEGQGKLEEAAAKLEMGCALSPAAEPCPASDRQACETWQKAAEKAAAEGRYRDAERLLHRAMLTADDAAQAKIAERLAKEDMAQGLRYERALMLDRKAATFVLEEVAKGASPAAAKAKEWLAKERPALLVAAVLAACGPEHEGSCTKAWEALQAAGVTGPDADRAREAFEAEERRVYPLRVQAEGFLPVLLGRFRRQEEYKKCLASTGDGESMNAQGDCFAQVWGGDAPEDRYDSDKNQDTLFRRTLAQIGDTALTSALVDRKVAAEISGNHVRQDIPKPKAAPKKKP